MNDSISQAAHDRAITNTSRSPHARFRSVDFGDCRWTTGFWGDKTRLSEETIVPHMGTLLKGDIGHAYNNFKIAAGLMEGEAKGMLWHDGDFYKWMEAVCYHYALSGDRGLTDELDELIGVIGQAQEDDGYLHTHVQIKGLERWSAITNHELYNSGHLITGGCIHHRLTGQSNWLDLAVKHADYLVGVFGWRPESLARFGFNPSQIMALVELYRTTADKRYLELAETFVEMRGSVPMDLHPTVPYWFTGDQCQMRTPLRRETEATGHAVTGMYLYAGAADVYAETGEAALLTALERIWSSAIERKMYVTGGLGQVHHGARDDFNMIHEGFVDDYLMPNSTAYNETCAAIASAMFNWRMLGVTGEAKYADIIELILLNGALVGVSDDGKKYFYANPLRMNHGQREYTDDCDCTESADREPYIECFCCPPNLARTLAKASGWAYSLTPGGVAVNLYGANRLETRLNDGEAIVLRQETDYPWDGRITLTVEQIEASSCEIALRIPGWACGATVSVNSGPVPEEVVPGTYLHLQRDWSIDDVITLDLPMEPTLIEGHPRIEETRNQVAISRGPLIYCAETPDVPDGARPIDVHLPSDINLQAYHRPDFLGGVSVLRGEALLRTDPGGGMYRQLAESDWRRCDMDFVPYFAWSNRGTAEMTVFMPVVWSSTADN
ncbi:Non-reducing end beta-L-arabinofuranosidase [Planctomycetes bacterium MalM25]|nr:Non-reducing end beta-L-arabinofuranosidase [Planctomycetes bacterium MalM25]